MPSRLFRTALVTAGILLLISCNDSKKGKKEKENNAAPHDTAVSSTAPASNNTAPAAPEAVTETVCYENEGLKYKTFISISFTTTTTAGYVNSEELESGKKESASFEGTLSGDLLTVNFKKTPPVVGSASEWTQKPWKVVRGGNNPRLMIPFKAKNYDTNQWEERDYTFSKIECAK